MTEQVSYLAHHLLLALPRWPGFGRRVVVYISVRDRDAAKPSPAAMSPRKRA